MPGTKLARILAATAQPFEGASVRCVLLTQPRSRASCEVLWDGEESGSVGRSRDVPIAGTLVHLWGVSESVPIIFEDLNVPRP